METNTMMNRNEMGVCSVCKRSNVKIHWVRGYRFCAYCVETTEKDANKKDPRVFCSKCEMEIKTLYHNTDEGILCDPCLKFKEGENRLKFKEGENCAECGKSPKVLFLVGRRYLCRQCNTKAHDKASHLLMRLVKLGGGGLLNVDTQKREYYKDVVQFQECGWFVKERVQFFAESKEAKELDYKEHFTLVYCGIKKCKRFPDVGWPMHMLHCDDTVCRIHTQNDNNTICG